MKNFKIPPYILLIVSLATLIALVFILNHNTDMHKNALWIIRIIASFAASGVSIAIPGTIIIGDKNLTLLQENPKISASGAIAVFVLVYLFNPINSL